MRRVLVLSFALTMFAVPSAQRPAISSKPGAPFKLATFEAGGKTRLGLVLGSRVLDIAGANGALTQNERLPPVQIPTDMRELIELYDRVSPRLYQIANHFKERSEERRVGKWCRASTSPQ